MYGAEDVMELLGKGQMITVDPAKLMKFILDNLDEIQELYETRDFDPISKRLRRIREERMWLMNGRPRSTRPSKPDNSMGSEAAGGPSEPPWSN
jgi:hypothetical protein